MISVIPEKELTCDVLIVGCGAAGSLAGLLAVKEGAEVITIEKNPEIGGEGMTSYASMSMGGGTDYQKAAGVEDSPELFFEEMKKWDPKADPDLVKAYTDNSVACCHFIRDLGIDWILTGYPINIGFGHSVKRIHNIKGLSPAYYKATQKAYEEAGGKLLTETIVFKLLTDATGRVIGSFAKDKDGQFKINSKSVILCCGGFQGNKEMLTRYVSPEAEYALFRGLPTNTGDGVLMGIEVRAATSGMGRIHGYVHICPMPLPYPPPSGAIWCGALSLVPNVGLTENFAYGILVNIRGERIEDETRARIPEQMSNALVRQPEARGYIIIDKPRYEDHLKVVTERAVKGWRKLNLGTPQIETADSIEALAEKIGINPSLLNNTIIRYNKAVESGTTHLLKIPKKNKHPLGLYKKHGINYLCKIETPPFYAISVASAISHTNGGLCIDSKCQVLDRERKVIPGLYSAGNDTVFWYTNYSTSHSQAFVQGYISGKEAATYAKTIAS